MTAELDDYFWELDTTPFAVVDVETTGFSPGLRDRVVEVAVVRIEGGKVTDQYATLVNPGRDVGPTHVHGITASDVEAAPRFEEIAGDVASRIDGAVIVAHNMRFDRSFLEDEFQRAGLSFQAHPGICTLHLAYQLDQGQASRKLVDCCARHGIELEMHHTAINDAQATAALFLAYLAQVKAAGRASLEELGCAPSTSIPKGWASLPCSGRSWTRQTATEAKHTERTYLSRLVESLPGSGPGDSGTAAYLEVLDRALEDRRVSSAEAQALLDIARRWGIPRATAIEAHRTYLAQLVARARADSVVTKAERADLELVRELLGLPPQTLEVLLAESPSGPRETPAAPPARPTNGLAGESVCFTGELLGHINGERITREQAEQLARDAGLIVRSTVVKKLGVLVTADAASQSTKARKARDQGTRIMAESAFWSAIGVSVE